MIAFLRKLPLAWRMLSDRPTRLALSMLGVGFAVVVMFTELGFLNGITDTSANFAAILSSDLVVVHPKQQQIKSGVKFSNFLLQRVRDVPGVQMALPLYLFGNYWSNPQDGSRNRVLIVGVDLDNPMIRLPEIATYRKELSGTDTVLFDKTARGELGVVVPGTRSRLGGHMETVVGLFSMGPNFAYEGNFIMSRENYLRLPGQSPDVVDLGMIKVAPGQDVNVVRKRIEEEFKGQLEVLTPHEVDVRERDFTTSHAPVGVVFGLGLLVGFAIGVVVCYQILFNEVSDHLPQFAMIKAMGHPPRFLTSVVLSEALILSFGGYAAGLTTALLLYRYLEDGTALRMIMTPGRASLVMLLSCGMCLVAGRLALKKVHATDPADLF